MQTYQTIEFIEAEIVKIPLYGKKVELENIKRLLKELNKDINLEEYLLKVPIIHVTGTNGKGSVCNMLSRIYKNAGYRVGLFTSPHIDHITERIQINNSNVDEKTFQEAYYRVQGICEQLKKEAIIPTFFEWMFSIALVCFYKKACDFLVIEVGIGGRLDTTNVLPQKALSIITPIGLDHQHLLGNSVESIAREKSGIIPTRGKVVVYNDQVVVDEVLSQVMREKEAICYNVLPLEKKVLQSSHLGIDFSIHNKYYKYDSIFLPTVCDYQMDNVGIVLTAVFALQESFPVTYEHIYSGIKAFYWPGRFEMLHRYLIIDGAHNEMGAAKLVETLKKLYGNQPLNLLIGIKEGKNYEEVLNLFCESNLFVQFFVCELTSTLSFSKELIGSHIKSKGGQVSMVNDLKVFLQGYLENPDTMLIGAGSLYLMSEIRKSLTKED
jgi:dihydrofolate synthase / folylpolyglutamate synthase